MKESRNYIAVPPGETIKEQLEYRNMSEREFAKEMGMSAAYIADLLEGNMPLTGKMAEKLEEVLGIDASFWNRYEAYYRKILAKVEAENESDRKRRVHASTVSRKVTLAANHV